MRYTRGGCIYDESERASMVQNVISAAEQSNKTANTYEAIGYHGHAHMARHQADRNVKAIARIMRGESVHESELRPYDG